MFIGMEIACKYKQKTCSKYFLETKSGKVGVRNEIQEVQSRNQ